MISVNSNILKLSFHKLVAKAVYPSLRSSNIHPPKTGLNWYKSPTTSIWTPPNSFLLPLISCNRRCMTLNSWWLTIDTSSMIIKDRCLYFILIVLNASSDRRLYSILSFALILKALWIVVPPMLKAATPVKAHNRILISSGFSPSVPHKYLCNVWYNASMTFDFPTPAPPVRKILIGSSFVLIHCKTWVKISSCLTFKHRIKSWYWSSGRRTPCGSISTDAEG